MARPACKAGLIAAVIAKYRRFDFNIAMGIVRLGKIVIVGDMAKAKAVDHLSC